ncbi:hypothetical protein M0R45_030848 [Rubus argutus]|uniref:Uncharacterized protein n=1 Tax=Rubus argutus TaxID=59490 RepID=A0AAW1WEA3_RUBAR
MPRPSSITHARALCIAEPSPADLPSSFQPRRDLLRVAQLTVASPVAIAQPDAVESVPSTSLQAAAPVNTDPLRRTQQETQVSLPSVVPLRSPSNPRRRHDALAPVVKFCPGCDLLLATKAAARAQQSLDPPRARFTSPAFPPQVVDNLCSSQAIKSATLSLAGSSSLSVLEKKKKELK